jgi:dihydrofolate reductase
MMIKSKEIKSRPKISVYIATSMDGYIARKDHGLDWLENITPPAGSDEDYGFKNFLASVDALIMGKNTYHTAVSAGADKWPYRGKRVIVLTSTLISVENQAEIYTGDIVHLVEKLHAEGIKHVYVDGGKTISQFLNQGLIDDITITVIPVILGSGISLFHNVLCEAWYNLKSVQNYSNSLVQLHYAVIR